MNKKIIILVLIVLCVALVGVKFYNAENKTSNDANQTVEQKANEAKDANKKHIDALSQKADKLKAESDSIAAEIKKLNEKIKADTQILKDAKAKYDLANDDYVRYKNAYKDGAVTKFDMDNATKNFEALSNTYKQAVNTLKYDENRLKTLTSKKQLKEEHLNKIMLEAEGKFKD